MLFSKSRKFDVSVLSILLQMICKYQSHIWCNRHLDITTTKLYVNTIVADNDPVRSFGYDQDAFYHPGLRTASTNYQDRIHVNDRQLWNLGMTRLNELHANISVESGGTLTRLLARYRETKETFAAGIAEVDAASDCRHCGGQCCLNGKYRVNVLDSLACIAAAVPTSADFSRKPDCPYGTESGCSMEPGLRPADCILFICDTIDRKLSPHGRAFLAAQEQVLRECISEASNLTGSRMGTPLLLWAGTHGSESKTKV